MKFIGYARMEGLEVKLINQLCALPKSIIGALREQQLQKQSLLLSLLWICSAFV